MLKTRETSCGFRDQGWDASIRWCRGLEGGGVTENKEGIGAKGKSRVNKGLRMQMGSRKYADGNRKGAGSRMG